MSARLTVCIPAYNQPALLRETLTSLCDQGLPRQDYLVAVSDDASPTPLADVIDEFKDRLQIIYDRSPENIGHLENFERASRLTDTPYLSFLSHDDVISPGHLGRALSLLQERPDTVLAASLVLCQRHPGALGTYLHGHMLRGKKASFTEPYDWDRTEWMSLALVGTPLSIVGSVFRADAFRACTEWHAFPLWHDRLMMGEMGLRGRIVSLPWIAGYYRVGEFQLSGSLWTNDRTEFKAVTDVVLQMCARDGIAVADFWVEQICDADPGARIEYLHMLNGALHEPAYEAIKQRAERQLGVRLHLGGRLDRLGVPRPVADWLRTIDRVVIRRQR